MLTIFFNKYCVNFVICAAQKCVCGCAPDPAGGAYSAPQTPYASIGGLGERCAPPYPMLPAPLFTYVFIRSVAKSRAFEAFTFRQTCLTFWTTLSVYMWIKHYYRIAIAWLLWLICKYYIYLYFSRLCLYVYLAVVDNSLSRLFRLKRAVTADDMKIIYMPVVPENASDHEKLHEDKKFNCRCS